MTKLTELTITAALLGLKTKQFSAAELVADHSAAIIASRSLNAFITETLDSAAERAKISDQKYAAGTAGVLEGIPLGYKDLFCTKGVLTTAASHILDGFKPPYDSTVTARLDAAGSVMMGKLNLDEFAMGSSNETSFYNAVTNPWRRRSDPNTPLVPGGSSGGSASAVTAEMVMGATGTDTGGSIRQPAAFCGLVGFKPSYGRCSRWGVVAFASSLDQAGPMTRSVADAALMFEVMAGFDPLDSTSANLPVPDTRAAVASTDLKGVKIGVPKEYRIDGTNPEIIAMWEEGVRWAKAAGAKILEVTLPHTKYALPTYYVIAPAEASANLARYDGVRYGLRVPAASLDEQYEATRAAGFGAEVKRRILIGTYVLSAGYYDAYYRKAQQVRNLITRDFTEAFTKVDLLLTPTAPSSAFAIGDKTMDAVTMYLNDVFTVPASLAGLPAISIPAKLDSAGLPLGLQLIGRAFDDAMVIRGAAVLEKSAGFTHRPHSIAG
ncbi:MAG: Asp-tRNA(Asn)/Glu-tRNA(Gln) amidotransferase subunit GatA [Candidatus Pacebacteria bacterium]|nr:Asp-tRNA(Asn)/Glu-tRNA(Gln) amidotransferase subunit GatA [Candidatus Paceibacterota bacterium]